jgi:DNA-binding NtrC family response regulator
MQIEIQAERVLPAAIDILSVSPDGGDHAALQRILNEPAPDAAELCAWRLATAESLSGALGLLRWRRCPVILCERYFPLGDWWDLLEETRQFALPPLLIVTSRHADEYLWAEALNLGAYDVLAKPFDRNETIRVVRLASQRWSWEAENGATARKEAGARLHAALSSETAAAPSPGRGRSTAPEARESRRCSRYRR